MPFRSLIPPGSRFSLGQLVSESELSGPSTATRIWVDDVDGDGKLDILVGDNVTLVSMAKGVSKKKYAEELEKWEKLYNAAAEAMGTAADEKERNKAQKHYQEVYQNRTAFMHDESTGYVWLYRRK